MYPNRIILIRHGESEANANPELHCKVPDHLHHLTAKGRQQAQEAGDRLKGILGEESYGVFTSPYERTLETMACVVKQLGRNPRMIHQDPRLREQDYGPVKSAELTLAERDRRKVEGRFFYRFSSGESSADVYDRVCTFMETLHRKLKRDDLPENILIFSHGTAMWCFLMRWYYWDYQYFEKHYTNPPNCHIAVMKDSPETKEYVLEEPFGNVFTG